MQFSPVVTHFRQNEAAQALEDVAKANPESYLQEEVSLNLEFLFCVDFI